MSFSGDLLDQARHLATRDKYRPKQASLRRAVSAAYYALFHLLLDEGAGLFVADKGLRKLLRRAFGHGEMKKAANSFASGGNLPDHVRKAYPAAIPTELRKVAKAFVNLQVSRHAADYDLAATFTRVEVQELIALAQTAVDDWHAVRARPADRAAIELFLAAMLLWDRWGK